ncbi:hypothetical protein NXC24_PB00504 (plasmid) [Rhizobium sp. NXC24]|nr:hypothetical protein NXC24_PB00504 [Rhizobium sp. NXC24]
MTATYEYHIGVDYHKSYSHLVVQDSSGKMLRSGRVKNDRQSLGGFLERYRENSHAVVEATRNWMVISMTFYVRLRTMTKNRIVTVFDRYPEQTARLKKLGDLFGKAGRVQLAQVKVSEIDRIQIDRGLAFIGDIDRRIKQSEATIRAMTKANGNVKLLKTIPGIGEFFARLIDAEIDDVSRFQPEETCRLCRACAVDLFLRRQDLSRQDHQAEQQVAALGFRGSGFSCHRQRSTAARPIRASEDQRNQ